MLPLILPLAPAMSLAAVLFHRLSAVVVFCGSQVMLSKQTVEQREQKLICVNSMVCSLCVSNCCPVVQAVSIGHPDILKMIDDLSCALAWAGYRS